MAVAFMTIAKETVGHDKIEACEVVDYIDTVNKALLSRGRSNLGDKTALDSLEAIRAEEQWFAAPSEAGASTPCPRGKEILMPASPDNDWTGCNSLPP